MKREKNLMPKKVNEPIGTRISKAVYSAKRISERIVGYIPYELSFVCASYTGRTLRPAKITPIEKGIVGILLVDETSSFEKIGLILGLDVVNDRAEQALLRRAVDTLRSFHAIEGDDSCLALNEVGRAYAEKGERPDTYTKEFELFIDQSHPSWRNIKNCIGDSAKNIERINTPCEPIDLDLEEIKLYAEQQAQDVHFPQNRYLLEIASWNEGHKAKYNVYVCFVQNIATNEVRTFVYDEHTETLNSLMSEYINSDSALVSELLENCIKLECANDDATTILEAEEVEAAKAEIPVEIIEAEKQLVKDEEDQTESEMAVEPLDEKAVQTSNQISRVPEKDRLHKKALYDSMSFEVELQKIFTADDPDEIWLISPWIRKTAFMNERGPMIENFLKDDSKRVFIAYSEPAANNDGKPMVDEEVEPGIKALEEQYPNFFYVQLPEFHLKNVIEVKGEQKVLFSGSFNVLSFSVSERQTHVRREEMALAHHTVARKKYDDCQLEFAQIYAQRIRKEVEGLNVKDIAGYKNEKMEYFLSLDNPEIRSIFSSIEDYIEEKTMQLMQEQVSKSLAELNQRLIDASNLGGVNQKDKKKLSDELAAVKKTIDENKIDDPSIIEDLENNSTLLEKIQVTKIFPGKDAKVKTTSRRAPESGFLTNEVNITDASSQEGISLGELSKEVRGVLTSKERGQNVALKSVLLAKKMVCPSNMSLDSYDKLFKMLAALNLLAVAIKLEVERKMKLQDVHNSVRSIIKKSDEFDELSIIYNSEDSRLILDLAGMQFQFERFNASDEIKEIINGHHNRVNGWNGTKSFFYSVELLEMANRFSIDE